MFPSSDHWHCIKLFPITTWGSITFSHTFFVSPWIAENAENPLNTSRVSQVFAPRQLINCLRMGFEVFVGAFQPKATVRAEECKGTESFWAFLALSMLNFAILHRNGICLCQRDAFPTPIPPKNNTIDANWTQDCCKAYHSQNIFLFFQYSRFHFLINLLILFSESRTWDFHMYFYDFFSFLNLLFSFVN